LKDLGDLLIKKNTAKNEIRTAM